MLKISSSIYKSIRNNIFLFSGQKSCAIQTQIQANLYHRKQQFQDSMKSTQIYSGSFSLQGCNSHEKRFSIDRKYIKSHLSKQQRAFSTIGIGTYKDSQIGTQQQEDLLMFNGLVDSAMAGINVIDTCSNFRMGRSQKCIGYALNHLIQKQNFARSQFFIGSKAGFVFNKLPGNLQAEVINGHCVHPQFLSNMLDNSLKQLRINSVDVYYLNNFAECQKEALGQQKFYSKLAKTFEFFQKQKSQKKLQFYGLSTWQSFRVPKTQKTYLDLDKIVKLAEKIGGKDHGFRYIQLPINFMMPQCFEEYQAYGSILETAQKLNINIISSSPLLNGTLINIPLSSVQLLCRHNGAKHLQFIRSIPSAALVSTLIGQKRNRHVKKNLEVLNVPLLSQQQWYNIIFPQRRQNIPLNYDNEQQ